MAGGRAGSLLDAIDRTVTAAGGAGLLGPQTLCPARRMDVITARQDAVAALCDKFSYGRLICANNCERPRSGPRASRLALERGGSARYGAISHTIGQAADPASDSSAKAELARPARTAQA